MQTVKGRNRYADEALTEIVIRDIHDNSKILRIEGGYIENRHSGAFVIAAKHPEATDDEGDSAYVAVIEGAGLVWEDMLGTKQIFRGVLLKANYWDDEDAAAYIEAKGYLSFTPPTRTWKPAQYAIEVSILST